MDFFITISITISQNKMGLFENSRLVDGEIENKALSKKIAELFDVCFDAFASAHRAEVTTCGV